MPCPARNLCRSEDLLFSGFIIPYKSVYIGLPVDDIRINGVITLNHFITGYYFEFSINIALFGLLYYKIMVIDKIIMLPMTIYMLHLCTLPGREGWYFNRQWTLADEPIKRNHSITFIIKDYCQGMYTFLLKDHVDQHRILKGRSKTVRTTPYIMNIL